MNDGLGPARAERVDYAGRVSPLRVVLAALSACLLTACAGYETATSESALPFDPDTITPRCYEGAHTLVVGPEPGCATLELDTFDDFGFVTCDDDGTSYHPLRVVHRGELPVLLRFTLGATGVTERQPIVLPASTSSEPRCCGVDERPLDLLDPDAGEYLPFAAWAIDGVAELRVARAIGTLLFEACTMEDSPARRDFRERCSAACDVDVECGFADDARTCEAACDAEAVRENEACLLARLDGMECELELLERCSEPLLDRIHSSCEDAHTRELFECLGA